MDTEALTAKEVCDGLKATSKQLDAWLKQGLPHTGKGQNRRFEPNEVEQWLLENGLAELVSAAATGDELIENTIADAVRTCARIMNRPNLPRRVFCEWMKEPGFPGRAGRPGRADGYFPCRAIARWRDGLSKQGKNNEEKTEREALLRIRRESEQFDLEKKRGEHIPVALVEQLLTRIGNSTAPLDDVPDIVASLVPQEFAVTVREAVQLQVKQVRTSIAALIGQAVKGRQAASK